MITFKTLAHFFKIDGWQERHLFMRGTRWDKGHHQVILDRHGYMLNGTRTSEDSILELLQITHNDIAQHEQQKRANFGRPNSRQRRRDR